MKRLLPACGLFVALLLACGCGSSKPEVPSWFKGDGSKGNPAAKNAPEQLQRDLSNKIKQLEKKMAALDEAIASVTKSRDKHLRILKNAKVKVMADFNESPFKDDKDLLRERDLFLKNHDELRKYEKMRKQYNLALLDGKEALDSLDRQLKLARAGITEKELEDLAVTIQKIDEKLTDTEPGAGADALKGDHDLDSILKGND
jgi:hypothetical protein